MVNLLRFPITIRNMGIIDIFNDNKARFDADLGIVHHFSDNVYARQMLIPKGYVALSHAHNYSHLSILASGKVVVKTDDEEREFTAPACIEIKAGVHHAIAALENSAWFCIHATDETDVSKLDEVLIQEN